MEYQYLNFFAKTCNINDLTDVLEIFDSQNSVSGHPKSKEAIFFMKKKIESVLEGSDDEKIVGVRDLKTNKLLVYSLIQMPVNSPFMFIRLGETFKNSGILGVNSHVFPLFRLSTMWAESKNRFDFFWTVRNRNFFAMMRLFKKYGYILNERPRYMFNIHSILGPEEAPKTSIEKFLFGTDQHFPRIEQMVVGHGCLKPQHRLEHFKDKLSYSVEEMSKFIYED